MIDWLALCTVLAVLSQCRSGRKTVEFEKQKTQEIVAASLKTYDSGVFPTICERTKGCFTMPGRQSVKVE